MKVIVYIGHHKVGSTALQVFLSQNWLALAQAGILYPSVETSGFSYRLAQTLQNGALETDGGQTSRPDMNIREPHSALAYQMMANVSDRKVPPQFKRLPRMSQMLRAIKKQVDFLKPETVILCSEVFANFGQVNPELTTQLLASFPDAEIEIYCALRRPDEYLISWHGQRLKVGEKVKPLNNGGLEPYFDTIHFNFRTVTEAWHTRLPDAKMIVRPYNEILKSGGSIEDFMAQISVDFPTDMTPVGRANESLSRAAIEIVRRGNHDLSGKLSHDLRQYFLSPERPAGSISDRSVEMFGATTRAELTKRFEPIHDYLSGLTGRTAFFDDINDMALERSRPEAEATADLLSQIDPKALPNTALRNYIATLTRNHAL